MTEQLRNNLGYDPVYIDRQPNMGPRQVLSPNELVVGRGYLRHYTKVSFPIGVPYVIGPSGTQELKITGLGQNSNPNVEETIVAEMTGKDSEENRIYMRTFYFHPHELGLSPNSNGQWERYYWLEDPSKNLAVPHPRNLRYINKSRYFEG